MKRCIASVGWGKDGLAMLHGPIERGMPLDEVVFYDTGMELDAICAERDRMPPLLRENGIRYVELRPKDPFWRSMFCRPVESRKTGEAHKHGYGRCGGPCRWGTTEKLRAIDRHAEREPGGATVYVGIAADETARLEKERKPYKRFPLADRGMREADCLAACCAHGHEREQDGVRLHGILDRVSCRRCKNENQKELRAIKENLPDCRRRLVAMEEALGNMKRRTLEEIGGACEGRRRHAGAWRRSSRPRWRRRASTGRRTT